MRGLHSRKAAATVYVKDAESQLGSHRKTVPKSGKDRLTVWVIIVLIQIVVVLIVYAFPFCTTKPEVIVVSEDGEPIIEIESSISNVISQPELEREDDEKTIFILLGSYRDPECANTIKSAFEQATYPDRLRFGVFQQHNYTDRDCTDFKIKCPGHIACGRFWQVKIDRVGPYGGMGPIYGRYRSELFYNDEDFVFQIDSHSRFSPSWDVLVIDMFRRIGNEFAVMTSYPKAVPDKAPEDWTPSVPKAKDPVVTICQTKILKSKETKSFKHQRGSYAPNKGTPLLTSFYAAGFVFARGHRLLRAPHDPFLPYVFDGEEVLMGARLWTSGYDFYVPDRDIIYHIYSPAGVKRPVFWQSKEWNTKSSRAQRESEYRINWILGLHKRYTPRVGSSRVDTREINKYGLGTKRPIDKFWEFMGVDLEKLETKNMCDKIKTQRMKRVTWTEGKDPLS